MIKRASEQQIIKLAHLILVDRKSKYMTKHAADWKDAIPWVVSPGFATMSYLGKKLYQGKKDPDKAKKIVNNPYVQALTPVVISPVAGAVMAIGNHIHNNKQQEQLNNKNNALAQQNTNLKNQISQQNTRIQQGSGSFWQDFWNMIKNWLRRLSQLGSNTSASQQK